MPEKVQRRRGETAGQMRTRAKVSSRAEAVTAASEKEKQHAPWRKMFEKETGKKYGIGTAAAYSSWLKKKRAEMVAKKNKGQTAKKQGEAIAPKSKKD